ncbi:MAG: diphthine synthase [Candidatus Woesearchaeota archaeon]
MTLYMIGIGLHDQKDISMNGLEVVKKCDSIYLEIYTSKLNCSKSDLEALYGKKIIIADREMVEKHADETILNHSEQGECAFLVIGDVFSATTHTDLFIRARKKGVKVRIIHNASVLTAVGITGLELYKFGKTTSIPFENKDVKSPIDVFSQNQKNNMHTLFLLDLDPKNDKYMTVSEAAIFIMEKGVSGEMLAVGCAGLGSQDPEIKAGKISEFASQDNKSKIEFSKLPQCLIIPAKDLHFIEEEAVNMWK